MLDLDVATESLWNKERLEKLKEKDEWQGDRLLYFYNHMQKGCRAFRTCVSMMLHELTEDDIS